MSLIQKYVQKNVKSVETPLPVQNLLYPDKVPQVVKVYPFTVQVELKHFESIRQVVENNLPVQFVMFEDIIDDLVSSTDGSPIDTNYLTLQDIQYIIYTQRNLTYGSEMRVRVQCDNCRQFYIKQKDLTDEHEINKLRERYHLKPFLQQELLKGEDFYQDVVSINIGNYKVETPTNKEEIIGKVVDTSLGLKIHTTLPRLGLYRKIKEYLLDFRKVVNEVYQPNGFEVKNFEEEYEVYSQMQNVQLFVNKVGDDIIDETNIQELPLLFKTSMTKKDFEKLNNVIQDYNKYILKIPYRYVCPRCGTSKEVDGMSFHFEFVFNEGFGV